MMNAAATEASLSHLLVNVVSSPFFLDTPRELQRITERDLFHLSLLLLFPTLRFLYDRKN